MAGCITATSATSETAEGATHVEAYHYDAAGRLDAVTRDGVLTASYGYDANGNRLTATRAEATLGASYDAQDQLLTYGASAFTYTPAGVESREPASPEADLERPRSRR